MDTKIVTTTYKGPTNTRGSRIIVKADGHRKSVSYDYAANDPHKAAVKSLFPDWEIIHWESEKHGYSYVIKHI